LAVDGEIGLAAEVPERGVEDDKVAGEHGGRDLVAVGAVAEESVDEAGGFGWLEFFTGFSRYGKMLGEV